LRPGACVGLTVVVVGSQLLINRVRLHV
jgi:hypothetical protein